MAIETLHSTEIVLPTVTLDSGKKCTATVAMEIVNDDIYCVRTYDPKEGSEEDGKKQPVVLHKLFNYLSGGNGSSSYVMVRTQAGTENIAVHANSLTYHNHVFYLVTRNGEGTENQVMAFGSDGIITHKYTYSGGKIGTINYYDTQNGALRFLISVKHKVNVLFRLVKISGTKLVDEGVSFEALVSDNNYETGNDSYYNRSTKQLYVTKFKNPDQDAGDDAKIVSNLVLQYDLSDGISGTSAKYSSVRTLQVDNQEGEMKFEIEGLCMYDNKKYVCVNSLDLNKNQTDAICKLYLP